MALFILVAENDLAPVVDLYHAFQRAAVLREQPRAFKGLRPAGGKGECLNVILAHIGDELRLVLIVIDFREVDVVVAALARVRVKLVEPGVSAPIGGDLFIERPVLGAGLLHAFPVVFLRCLVVSRRERFMLAVDFREIVLHGCLPPVDFGPWAE